jgi:hypothetical protein
MTGTDRLREPSFSPPKFPHIEVELSTSFHFEENAFVVIGKVAKALRRGGATPEEVATFMKEVTSVSYSELDKVCSRWVEWH